MGDTITLNTKESQRSMVLTQIDRGLLTAAHAAELLGVSVRQVRRILAAYRKEGVAALAHGNRGARPVHAIDPAVRQKVLELARSTYAGCNDQHLSELLAEREGVTLSRSSVRRILRAGGVTSPRKRRAPAHRSRRERYAQEGMLVQIDASRHAWLEKRGPMLSLVAAIDDATGIVLAALFREQEDAHGYFLLLEQIVHARGRPIAVYRDRHGIFERSDRTPDTVEEQLAGQRQPTQFGRLLEELEIGSIGARSPQAKGRIERLWETFQDRLVAELRIAEATTVEEATRVLSTFLPRFNARFAVPAAVPGSAYRPITPGLALGSLFCFKYVRTVASDNTVRLGATVMQLAAGPRQRSYAHARVSVHELLDGSLEVWFSGQRLAAAPAPPDGVTLRARKGRRAGSLRSGGHDDCVPSPPTAAPVTTLPPLVNPVNPAATHPTTPGPDHPWRKPFKQAMVTKS